MQGLSLLSAPAEHQGENPGSSQKRRSSGSHRLVPLGGALLHPLLYLSRWCLPQEGRPGCSQRLVTETLTQADGLYYLI